jgi:hypothetical protein
MATAVEPLAADPFSSGILPDEPPDLVQKDDAFGAELYSEGDFEVSARPAPRLVSRRTPDQDGNAPKKTRRPRGSKALSQEPVGNLADRLADAGERFLERLATVIAEVTELREANRALLAENARLTSRLTVKAKPRARIPRPRGRRPQMATLNGKKMGHRATPSEVTGTVVMAVISKLEKPTAGEIAAEITKAGVKVSGRAIRFIAEKAGAKTFRGADGKQHYVISH